MANARSAKYASDAARNAMIHALESISDDIENAELTHIGYPDIYKQYIAALLSLCVPLTVKVQRGNSQHEVVITKDTTAKELSMEETLAVIDSHVMRKAILAKSMDFDEEKIFKLYSLLSHYNENCGGALKLKNFEKIVKQDPVCLLYFKAMKYSDTDTMEKEKRAGLLYYIDLLKNHPTVSRDRRIEMVEEKHEGIFAFRGPNLWRDKTSSKTYLAIIEAEELFRQQNPQLAASAENKTTVPRSVAKNKKSRGGTSV